MAKVDLTQELNQLTERTTTTGQSAQQQRRLTLEAELRHPGIKDPERLDAQLELAQVLLDLNELAVSFEISRQVLDRCLSAARYGDAVSACRIMYLSEQPQAISALGHGLWLALAFPIDPEQSWQMFRHLVEEIPPQSDGAAVVAMLAYFLMEKRAAGSNRDRLIFLARQQVAKVAKNLRGITGEEEIEIWAGIHDLDNVDMLLERMARMLDAIVQDWWFDREALRASFPDH